MRHVLSTPWLVGWFLLGAASYQSAAFVLPSRTMSFNSLRYSENNDSPPVLSNKENLLELLSDTPRNAATSTSLSKKILNLIRLLECECPSADEQVATSIGGTWELLWTTQDRDSPESQLPFSFINPLENQSYSNNPGGRANPVLPVNLQNRLEEAGFLPSSPPPSSASTSTSPLRAASTQSVNLETGLIQNVVNFQVGSRRRVTMTVAIAFTPDSTDPRRINVQFTSCRVKGSLLNVKIPFGALGPTGWLRTSYVDDNLRITRGHKGSVFVLIRPQKKNNLKP